VVQKNPSPLANRIWLKCMMFEEANTAKEPSPSQLVSHLSQTASQMIDNRIVKLGALSAINRSRPH
jgi:hypothetical protein